MSYKNLAEAIILQSLEDLWHPLYSNVTRERIRQLEVKALRKIQYSGEGDTLRVFLEGTDATQERKNRTGHNECAQLRQQD